MKKLSLIIGAITVLGLSACNSGGGGSSSGGGSSVNQMPYGYCHTSGGEYYSPMISANPYYTAIFYSYIPGYTTPQIIYNESESGSNGFSASTNPTISQANLHGACASGITGGGLNNIYDNDVVYYTNCNAQVTGSQLQFNSNYEIYLPTQYPGVGNPIKTGTMQFTCTLN